MRTENKLRHYTQFKRWNSYSRQWEYRKFYWDSKIQPSDKLNCPYKGHWQAVL